MRGVRPPLFAAGLLNIVSEPVDLLGMFPCKSGFIPIAVHREPLST